MMMMMNLTIQTYQTKMVEITKRNFPQFLRESGRDVPRVLPDSPGLFVLM